MRRRVSVERVTAFQGRPFAPSVPCPCGRQAARAVEFRRVTAADFRRLALALEGAEEGSHMGAADFRVGGRIFATLASVQHGFGNLMLTPEMQADFVAEWPHLFLPVAGGWGRMGITHIRLREADRETLAGALHAAWALRVEKNRRSAKPAGRRATAGARARKTADRSR